MRIMKIKNRKSALLISAAIFAVLFFANMLGSDIAIGSSHSNSGNKWSSSFKYLHGARKGLIRLDSADSMLIFDRAIRKGSLTFDVYGPENGHIAVIDSYLDCDTLKGLHAGQTYRIVAKADNASGRFSVRTD